MFDTVNELSRRLPRPVLTDDPASVAKARERYLANANLMRSEAIACLARAFWSSLRRGWHWSVEPATTPPSRYA